MIRVADLDLLDPYARLPALGGELLVLVRAGDEILGHRLLRHQPLEEREVRGRLIAEFKERLYALDAIRPKSANGSPPPSAVSLILCARSEALARASLRHVQSLDPAPGEVVVAGWGTEGEEIAAWAEAAEGVTSVAGDAHRTLVRARNAGWRGARGDLLAFVTEAGRPDRKYVLALCRAFTPSEVAAVTGLIAPSDMHGSPQVVFGRFGGLDKGHHRRLYHRDVALPARESLIGTGENVAFRRNALEALGGFDESLGPGTDAEAGEDLDALWRLLLAGHVVAHEPSAVVRHFHPPSWERVLSLVRSEAAALAAHRSRDDGAVAAVLAGAWPQLGAIAKAVRRRQAGQVRIAVHRLLGVGEGIRKAGRGTRR